MEPRLIGLDVSNMRDKVTRRIIEILPELQGKPLSEIHLEHVLMAITKIGVWFDVKNDRDRGTQDKNCRIYIQTKDHGWKFRPFYNLTVPYSEQQEGLYIFLADVLKVRNEDVGGTEEGEQCRRNGCDGVIVPIDDGMDCLCHLNPPCHHCADMRYECDMCDYESE